MTLYLLTRKVRSNPTYDVVNGFVIRARNIDSARLMASMQAGDEGPNTWLKPEHSVCMELSPSGLPKVILRDFNAG